MKTTDFLHLNVSDLNKVTTGLQQLLADYQVYYTNLRGFHWNLKGHSFFVLHSKFEEMYDNAAEKVDELAERILMLGGKPVNKFSDYLQTAKIKEISGMDCQDDIIKNILESLSYILGEERELLTIASDANDEGTVDLMTDYIKEQEKLIWMLVAFSTKSCEI